ncbi:MAG TPA: DUF1499 domain-containing protein [Burkholderiaceae bacterium]|nr:DUF1499 domain-containing protein [Burkholderiaceae bacterium]
MVAFASVVGVLVVVIVLVLLAARLGLFQGRPPKLGVRDGRLKPPSRTPNSVSSQAHLYPEAPPKDYAAIAPFRLRGDGPASIARLRTQLDTRPGTRIVEARDDYLYVQFTTRWMRFVDDAEFWYAPAEQVIHVRSSSRVGRKDYGVNRKRIEAIRRRYDAA